MIFLFFILFFVFSSLSVFLFHLPSLLFSSLFFSSLFFSLFSFFSDNGTHSKKKRNSNTCHEPGPAEMSDGMRSTNICQKPFILSCLVLSCLVLSCLVLSCLVLSCLVLSCLVLSCLVLSCLVLSCLVLSCLVLSPSLSLSLSSFSVSGRFECAHGDVLNGHTGGKRSSPVLHTRICPRMIITCFRGSPKKLLDLSHFQV